MLDFHTHILPGIDDGSKSVAMSLKMLQESEKQGIKGIVLTPHFYADSNTPQRFLENRMNAAESLSRQLGRLEQCPQLLLGAEVHYYRGIGRSSSIEQLCIGQSNLILVEMPFVEWSSFMIRDIEDMHSRLGLQVIIAHIDRYLSMQSSADIDALREDAHAFFQANAEFFLHRSTRRKAVKMLERQEIQLLGSDCHNVTSRAPNLGEAVEYIEHKLGESALRRVDKLGTRLFRAAGAAI